MHSKSVLIAVVFVLSVVTSFAQLTPFYQWTLLPQNQMDEIIGEASGETALNHAIEMTGYQRNRPKSEYGSGTFREGKYVLDKLNEYGIKGAEIERFEGGQTWDGIKGELWEISPNRKKLVDYDDIALSLAQGSRNTDVEAELVWIEEGSEADIESVDLEGKIAVTSSTVGRVHGRVVNKGAVGVLAFGSSRELEAPTAIPASGIRGSNATFGFYLTPREGYKLRDRLIRGEKIKVHAVVESEMLPYELQVPTCVIPGTDTNSEEIIFSAHIYEGYTKQGANDNVSGSAVILEVARALHQMFKDERLERPKRSIRFIWIPEYSGTIPWVQKHRDIMDKTLCNINLDMVGLHLKSNNSFFSLMRTTYGNPHYINDVMENYFVYMGEVNREILANRGSAKIANQIIAPSGSDDPFYYQIEQHYGASDHEVFNHWSTRVPGVMLITWPDLYYHTSEDIPNKLDATQMKRAAIIAAAGAYTIAAADEDMAVAIAGNVYANALKRMSVEVNRAQNELNKADKENFEAVSKKVLSYLEASYKNETATIFSVQELSGSTKLATNIAHFQTSLGNIYQTNKSIFDQNIKIRAKYLGIEAPSFDLTDLEKKADAMIPTATDKVQKEGFRAGRSIRTMGTDVLEKYPYRNIASSTELCALINGKNSALDIKKMLDTQYKRESDLQHVMNYIELLKLSGLVR